MGGPDCPNDYPTGDTRRFSPQVKALRQHARLCWNLDAQDLREPVPFDKRYFEGNRTKRAALTSVESDNCMAQCNARGQLWETLTVASCNRVISDLPVHQLPPCFAGTAPSFVGRCTLIISAA